MPVAAPSSPPVELVMSLFDLTPAEARIARGLAAGKTVDDLACYNGVSPDTVRVQVRGILEKTGCQRQTDVVSLLVGNGKVTNRLEVGDTCILRSGGGFGPASERSLDMLREAVRQGYISIEGAWNNYSVRFDPKSLEVIERRA